MFPCIFNHYCHLLFGHNLFFQYFQKWLIEDYISRSSSNNISLTLSWRRPILYRNQSIDLLRKSVDWFLYDIGLRHERVNIRNEIWRWSLTKAGNTREYWLKLNLHLKKWGKICFTQPSLVKLIIEYFFNIEITMCKNYHVYVTQTKPTL